MSNFITLSDIEARVLSVLIEKEKTVPDSYPMSLNSLMVGCNQKTSRDPVMSLSEADISVALDSLQSHALVIITSGGRVMRYGQNARKVFKLPEQSVAILAVLMLRGAQTAGELRLNCDRLHSFADISSVDAFLEELAESEEPWVVRLPKQAGSREHRWQHLLCGEPDLAALSVAVPSASRPNEVAELRAEVARLTEELDILKQQVARIENLLI